VFIIVFIAGFGIGRQRADAAKADAGSRKIAPSFALKDANGARVRLSDYKGKVVLLDVWATWCTGCKVEIPWYIEFNTKYKDLGLVSIGVAMDAEGWPVVRPYLEQHPINYRIVVADADFSKRYAVTSMPVTLLIDRRGRIADEHVGIVGKEAWAEEIRQLLQEK
jgi:cytochrome c biogenesis protein CcmG/thiol:disulfide interchange protein DsbE